MRSDRRRAESLNHFVQKAANNEALSQCSPNASRTEIKKFFLVNLAGSCAVSAADVIRQNFQAGHGIRLRIIAEQQVADLLISIGEMGVRFHPDQAAENTSGAAVECVLVE